MPQNARAIATTSLALLSGSLAGLIASSAAADHHMPIAVIGGYSATSGIEPDAQCWGSSGLHFAPPPGVDHGALALGPTSPHAMSAYARTVEPFSFADGAAVEATLVVFSSPFVEDDTLGWTGYAFRLHDASGNVVSLGIADDRIVLDADLDGVVDATHMMTTTDGYHTYRIDVVESSVTVTVDGAAVLFGATGTSSETNLVTFGDLSIAGVSTTATTSILVEAAVPFSPADLDQDGAVNATDLATLIGAWGTSDCAADLTFDGVVDAADFAILFGAWG